MLTYKDLQEIGKLIDEKLKEAFKHLPTKEDFYTRMDALSKEIKDAREELDVRVAVVEKKVGIHALKN